MARRTVNVFNLAFLDVMACGLGAVVLLFMIINHASELRSDELNQQLQSEVMRLQREVVAGKKSLVEVNNSLESAEEELIRTEGLSRTVIKQFKQSKVELAELDKETIAREEHTNALKADLKSVEEDVNRLEASRASQDDDGRATRSFVGEADRQYLTGLKVGGKRVLILVDSSASMLDETIVNIVRWRNLPDEQKVSAKKWKRTIRTVDWLTTQIPVNSKFQIYAFNVRAQALIAGSEGKWLETSTGRDLNQAVENLRRLSPRDGTSLHKAFAVIKNLKPLPDNVYLITDGLPTQGEEKPGRTTVSGKRRLRHFESAVKGLPRGVPVNTILFPMEGDPMAASAFWQLAQLTSGSFLSPSRDWP